MASLPAVGSLNFGNPFIRLWEHYLASCEACFAARVSSDLQIAFGKPM